MFDDVIAKYKVYKVSNHNTLTSRKDIFVCNSTEEVMRSNGFVCVCVCVCVCV